MKKWSGILVIVGLLAAGVLTGASLVRAQDGTELPEQVVIEHPGLFPEGVEWDPQGSRFLVGSLAEGTIYEVADDGTATALFEDEGLMASVGLEVDEANNRLLVCNSNPVVFGDQSAAGQATLASYDLETGEQVFMADLSALGPEDARFFANDVAVDGEGNAYVTNSFAGVIYKVDMEGNASIFVEDERLAAPGFGLNGIVFHADGFLLAGVSAGGQLFKIPLDDPAAMTEVMLDAPVTGVDGMMIDDNGDVFVVSGDQSAVLRLQSEDEWATATTVETVPTEQPATTGTIRDGSVYVVYAHLDQMGAETPQETFEIVQVPFEGESATMEEGGASATEEASDGSDTSMGELDGDALVSERCTVCHDRERIDSKDKDEAGWTETVDRMIGYGAQLNAEERQAVIDYLVETH